MGMREQLKYVDTYSFNLASGISVWCPISGWLSGALRYILRMCPEELLLPCDLFNIIPTLFPTSIKNDNLSNSQDPESCCSLWHQRRLSYWNRLARYSAEWTQTWRVFGEHQILRCLSLGLACEGCRLAKNQTCFPFNRRTWGCWCSCRYRGAYGRHSSQNQWPCGIEMGCRRLRDASP